LTAPDTLLPVDYLPNYLGFGDVPSSVAKMLLILAEDSIFSSCEII
jgi:hypothetical protein